MKFLITLLISTILTSSICAQDDYVPFAKSNKFWFYGVYQDFETNRVVNSYVMWLGKDTIIDDKIYFSLFKSDLDGLNPSPTNYNFIPYVPYRFKDKNLVGLISEDTLNREVFIKYQDTLKLLYEFNLDIGQRLDSRLLSIIKPANWPEIDSLGKITDVKFEESYNMNRKTWVFNGSVAYGMPVVTDMRLIEGIGISSYNGFYPSFDKLFNFCEGTLEQCNIISSTRDDMAISTNQLTLFPNPVLDIVNIKSSFDLKRVEILDQDGHIVLTSAQNIVDVSSLQAGMYYVKSIASTNKSYYVKFVKM
jgi:hypothetical protein